MNTNFRHRLETLEREKGIAAQKPRHERLSFFDKLTQEEKSDCAAYAFCKDGKRPWPSWKERREDEYYESLIAKATGKPLEEVKAAFLGE